MHRNDTYVFSAVFVSILTAVTLFTTLNIKATLVLYGLIMILITLRSICDDEERIITFPMLLFTGLFAFFSGNVHAFTIMYGCRFRSVIRVLLPSSAYFVY